MTISCTKIVSNVAPLSSSTSRTSKTTSNCHAIQASVKNWNESNTCFINATLQCLSIMVQFLSSYNAVSKTLSPFLSSFVKIISLLKSSKPVTQFLKFLNQVLAKSGRKHFNIFEQQDTREILACVLDELCGDFIFD